MFFLKSLFVKIDLLTYKYFKIYNLYSEYLGLAGDIDRRLW